MFDFKKLNVYSKAKSFCLDSKSILSLSNADKVTCDQFRRASFSIMLNIAEGSSRFTKKDKRNFLIVARGSAFECDAILEYLYESGSISKELFQKYEDILEEISRMLFGMINKLDES
jgi:four helix bundle protein